MKYYFDEYEKDYQRVKELGLRARNELHGDSFENFSIRPFLECALEKLSFTKAHPLTLDYGTGTGPVACFLAKKGFLVTGIDISPTAIEIARQNAAREGVEIEFKVDDICRPKHQYGIYDLIVDSFCLQSIVLDHERQKAFSFVKRHLSSNGFYVIATAGYSPKNSYEGQHFDSDTGIVYRPIQGNPTRSTNRLKIEGRWYVPYRRHLTSLALRAELKRSDFSIQHLELDDRAAIKIIASFCVN